LTIACGGPEHGDRQTKNGVSTVRARNSTFPAPVPVTWFDDSPAWPVKLTSEVPRDLGGRRGAGGPRLEHGRMSRVHLARSPGSWSPYTASRIRSCAKE
jgi:hypothetical protein